VSSLIWVKRHCYPEFKLESDPALNTPTMPENRFSEFSVLLQAQRKQLLGEVRDKIAALGEQLGAANQSKITNDEGLADAAAEVEVAMAVRESQELQEIEAALARIDNGSYGSCADCGDEIGQARLKANPAAKRCLPCQEQYERAQGQIHLTGS